MPTITSSGLGSGLNINGIISQLMTLERQPLVKLDTKEAGFQTKLTAYGTVKGAVSTFQTAMQGLSSLSKFQSLKATSADSSVFTASAASTAAAGNYAVEVKQLAQAHKVASKAFSTTTDTVGTGTLTIQFGTYDSGGNTFTVNSAKSAQTVVIDSTNSSLSGIRDAINAAKIGVSASILNDGTGNKLVLTSTDTGVANSLKITVSNDSVGTNVDDNGLSQLAYDPTGTLGNGKNLTETITAQNALLKVDGIDNISKASNTVTDVIQSATLTLLKQSPANTPTTLTIARDSDSVKKAVEDFVKAYNDLNKTVTGLTAYNSTTKQAGTLQGEASALSISSQIRRTLNSSIAGLTGAYTTLSAVGVSFQKDGTLSLDSTKFQSAIDSNFDDIAGVFANVGKASDSLVNYTSATSTTKGGVYAVNISQLATHGALNGATTAALADTGGTFDTPFVVDADNDTFSLKLDGVQSGTITLTQGTYTTAVALTAEIQTKLNGDSALKAASITATVTFDSTNDRLVITSDRYGSASTVEITAVDTDTASDLGLSVASGTAGVNVAGTINGAVASGSGRFLTGASGNASEGLKIEITGGATGDRGTIAYSQGYAYQLDQLASQLLGASGPIESRTQGINSSIEDIKDRRAVLERRLVDVERRLTAQFTALDSLVAQLRSTSDFLTQQLASLPGAKT